MRHEDFVKFHSEFCDAALKLSIGKNQDYASPATRQGDRFAVFANFLQAERLNICTTEQGILVRMSDKLSRLANLMQDGHERGVSDETVDDTLLDLINYSVLLAAYRKVKSGGKAPWPAAVLATTSSDGEATMELINP